MAKILVADDNSNVQKTVTLALAELGVEVVAVNNGDAAVRKLADFSPDLVLADIFMPVRNGYEVCEYVKKDPRFSQVPVVLLVGAFDPLDEREAQRVGADGILKKPFVPPDPLITMVKTLLNRTLGERLVAVAASKPAVAAPAKAGGNPAVVQRPAPAAVPEESPEEQFRPPVDRVSFGEGDHPIAFGQLLDSPAKASEAAESEVLEPVDNDQILTSARDAALGDPIFWKSEEPAPESNEENPEAEEESDLSSELPMRPWKLDEEEISRRVEADSLPAIEPFELVREEKDVEGAQISPIVAASQSILQDPAAQASLTVQSGKLPDLASNPIEWMASIPPPPVEPEPLAAPGESGLKIGADASMGGASGIVETGESKKAQEAIGEESSAEGVAPVTVSVAAPETATGLTSTAAAMKLLAQSVVEDSALPAATHDWADLTARLESTAIDAVAENETKPSPAPNEEFSVGPASNASSANSSSVLADPTPSTLSPENATHSTPKHDWADLSATLAPIPSAVAVPITQKHSPVSPLAQSPAELPTVTNSQAAPATFEEPVAQPPAQIPEDTAHSLTKHDWADMTATLEPISMETAPVLQEHPSTAPIPPLAHAPTAPLAVENSQSISMNFEQPAAKPPAQTPEDTAHSLPKHDWADMTATLEPITLEDVPVRQEHAPVQPSTPPVLSSVTNTPSPSLDAKPSVQSPEETAHSIPKHDWSDFAKGLPPLKPATTTGERPKPAPGIVVHGPVHPVAHTQNAALLSAQAPVAPVVNTNPVVSAPVPQIPGVQIPGAPVVNTPLEPASCTLSGQPDPALVEAVVQRVLDKMRPQVVDIITKEFLRPVVQALVHREINKR